MAVVVVAVVGAVVVEPVADPPVISATCFGVFSVFSSVLDSLAANVDTMSCSSSVMNIALPLLPSLGLQIHRLRPADSFSFLNAARNSVCSLSSGLAGKNRKDCGRNSANSFGSKQLRRVSSIFVLRQIVSNPR